MNRLVLHEFIIGKALDQESFFDGKVTRVYAIVRLSDIRGIDYNPPHRGEGGSKELRDSIKEAGGNLCPLHLWQDMTMIDGHGRDAELKANGKEFVRAYIYKCDREHRDLIYAMLNDGHRKHTGSDKGYVMAHGGPEMAGKAHRQAVNTLSKYADPKEYDPFPAPSYVNCIEYATNRIAQADAAFCDPKKRKKLWLALFGYVKENKEYHVLHEELRNNKKRYFEDLKKRALKWDTHE